MTNAGSTTIASPCISLCKINPELQYCEGCLRTLDEITSWVSADEEAKQEILQHVAQRRWVRSLQAKTTT